MMAAASTTAGMMLETLLSSQTTIPMRSSAPTMLQLMIPILRIVSNNWGRGRSLIGRAVYVRRSGIALTQACQPLAGRVLTEPA